jgi:hypothetical protein
VAQFQIDLERAKLVLLQAMLDVDMQPSESLLRQARELELEIVNTDYTLNIYHGVVVGQDHKSWLIKYRNKGAVILNFEEIENGEVVPRFGDEVTLLMRFGIVTVEVKVAERNQRVDRKRKGTSKEA